MISRRGLLACGSGLAIGGLVSPARTSAAPVKTYDDAVRLTWAPFHVDGGARELIRYATLAANSHNTQPWKFKSEQRCITIAPDFARRCPAVDPDDHHLFVSLGCAAENAHHAAHAHGLEASIVSDPSRTDDLRVVLEPTTAVRTKLFEAITDRQCTRAPFDGAALTAADLDQLSAAGK